MKIMLVSDSHGNKSGIEKIFEKYKFDYLFHMGDGVKDLGLFANLENVYCVAGNCDVFSAEGEEKIIKLGGYTFLITHGHRYSVKSNLNKIVSRGKEIGANFVCYGHTHNANYIESDGLYIINPGAFQKGKCVMLSIDRGISIENIVIE